MRLFVLLICLVGCVACTTTPTNKTPGSSANHPPETETDPAQIVRYRKDRLSWERKARQLTAGTRRSKVERILPTPSPSDPTYDNRVKNLAAWGYYPGRIQGWQLLDEHFIFTAAFSWSGRTNNFEEECEKFSSFQRLQAPPKIVQVHLPPPPRRAN